MTTIEKEFERQISDWTLSQIGEEIESILDDLLELLNEVSSDTGRDMVVKGYLSKVGALTQRIVSIEEDIGDAMSSLYEAVGL